VAETLMLIKATLNPTLFLVHPKVAASPEMVALLTTDNLGREKEIEFKLARSQHFDKDVAMDVLANRVTAGNLSMVCALIFKCVGNSARDLAHSVVLF
jgi:hypothetical protein